MKATPAAILVGGAGTRLRSAVPDRPKVLALVDGRPLLDHLLATLAGAGFTEVLLCCGHRAEEVRAFAGDGAAWGLRVTPSVEPEPLGTGGALRLAAEVLGRRFFALNGDALLDVPWSDLLALQTPAPLVLVAARVDDVSDAGALELSGEAGLVELRGFCEKGRTGPGWVNAGVYRCEPAVFDGVPPGTKVSFETEVVPGLLNAGRPVAVYASPAVRFHDIGTPERYRRADRWR